MRRYLLLLAFFWIFYSVEAQSLTEQAAEAYQSHDFATAITLYENALLQGQHSGELYFNLGNAYFEAGELGYALLNYRKAQQFIPRDFDVTVNISRVFSARTAVSADESDWLNRFGLLTNDLLTLYEFSLVAFALWSLFFLLLVIHTMRRIQNFNYRLLLASITVLLFWVGLAFAARYYVETERPLVVVLADETPIMSGYGEQYQRLYSLDSAAELRVLEEREGWLRFILPNGRQGWVLKTNVGFVTEN